jgi:hypothetical protein
MDRKQAELQVMRGREFYHTYTTKGFQEIFIPRLKILLEKADQKCHDLKLRADYGKAAIVEYNTLARIFKLFEDIQKDAEQGREYLRSKGINI